jgi:hypothetical protein
MNTCTIDSRLIWNAKDIAELARDIYRVAGKDKMHEFEIILVPTLEGQLFRVKIKGPDEYRATIERMSDQQAP